MTTVLQRGEPALAQDVPAPWRESLVGTARLVRLIVRRDRIRLALWLAGLGTLMVVSAQSIASLYDTPERIRTYVATVGDNAALVVFSGPGYGFDRPSAGVILVNETTLWMSLGAALMSVFLVNRHTRAEEDSERADLVRSTVVGRHAPVAAVLVVAIAANVVLGTACALAAIGFGFPATGSLALGAGIGLAGVTFAAATAVAAQVAATSRSALGLGAGVVGLAFVVRGIGDVSAPLLSWTSPFGWAIGVRAYAGERWWTLAGLVALTAGGVATAVVLSVRRDLGSGLLPQRAGRDHAAPWMCGPMGLALRLQRATVIGWAVGLAVTGIVYGSVADGIEAMIADNPELADYFATVTGASLAESYLATSLRLLALVASGFAISSALRNRSEEAAGYAESMLATPVSRVSWAIGHLAVTVGGTLVLLVVSGAGMGATYAATVGDAAQVPRLVVASLSLLPAVLVLAGIATALFGWLPRAATAAWGALAATAVIDVFGPVLRLPHRATLVSPFAHLASVPAEASRPLPFALTTVAGFALLAAGVAGFTRRDLASA